MGALPEPPTPMGWSGGGLQTAQSLGLPRLILCPKQAGESQLFSVPGKRGSLQLHKKGAPCPSSPLWLQESRWNSHPCVPVQALVAALHDIHRAHQTPADLLQPSCPSAGTANPSGHGKNASKGRGTDKWLLEGELQQLIHPGDFSKC